MRRFTSTLALLAVIVPFGLPAAHADDPASWFPADTLLFIGNEGMKANEEAFNQTALGRYMNSEVGGVWRSQTADWSAMFQMLEAESGGELDSEMLSFMTDLQAGLTDSPSAIALTKLDLTAQPPMIELSAVIDDAKMSKQIFELAKAESPEGTFTEVEIEGHSFLRAQIPDLGTSGYIGVVDGALLAGIGDNSVLRLIARKDLGAASLAGRPEYVTGCRRAIGDGDLYASVFVDLPRIRDLLVPMIEQQEPNAPIRQILSATGIDKCGPLTMAGAIRGDRFRNGVFVAIDGEHDLASAPKIDPAQLRGIPKGTLGFWAGKLDLAKLVERVLTMVEGIDADQGKLARLRVENAVQAFTGMSASEFLSAFGSSWTIYEDPNARGLVPGFVMLMRPKSPEQLDTLCTQMTGMATAFGGGEFEAKVHEYEFSGETIRYAQFHKVPSPFAPAWALVDGDLICTLHPTILANVIDARKRGDAGSITTEPDFADSRRRLNVPATSMIYIDSAQIMECLYPMMIYGQQALFGLLELGHDPMKGDYTLLAGKLPLRRNVVDATCPTLSVTSRLSDGYLLATEAVSPDSDPMIIGGAIFCVGTIGGIVGTLEQQAMEEIIIDAGPPRREE